MKSLFLLGMLLALSVPCIAQSTADFFPLQAGTVWTYRYEFLDQSHYDRVYLQSLAADTGIVRYRVVSVEHLDTVNVWTIEETDSLQRRVYNISGTDTTYLIAQTHTISLFEYLDSLHTIRCSAHFPPFTLPVTLSPTRQLINRYGPDSLYRTLSIPWSGVFVVSDQLTFQRDKGLTYAQYNVSYSPTSPDYQRWTATMLSMTTAVHEDRSLPPGEYALLQNYPNPFNPSTTITFTIPRRSFVSLKIFDVLGRDVATIVVDELPAGTYQRQWNASEMPSGIYFYRIEVGTYSETKRLILLR